MTQPEDIFLIQREKIKKFGIFRGNFPSPNPGQKWLTRPDEQKIDLTLFWPGPITTLNISSLIKKEALNPNHQSYVPKNLWKWNFNDFTVTWNFFFFTKRLIWFWGDWNGRFSLCFIHLARLHANFESS